VELLLGMKMYLWKKTMKIAKNKIPANNPSADSISTNENNQINKIVPPG
jgi:hypothetical protein